MKEHSMLNTDIRSQIAELGLSQSGLARTFKIYNDPREFAALLRWVQRAVAQGIVEDRPYVLFMLSIIRDNLKRRDLLKSQVEMIEAGKLHSTRNLGYGPEDITAEILAILRKQIEELDRLLVECRPVAATKAA